jgi:large subunit ribosomal protein L10
VEEIKAVVTGAPLWMVSDYRGLPVADLQALRRRIKESGGNIRIAKNSLARRAVDDAGLEDAKVLFDGPSAITECYDDLVGPARALWEDYERDDRWAVRGGVLGGELISTEQVQRIASLPGRDQLLAQAVWGIESPISGLVHSLEGILSGFVYALQGRIGQLEESDV